MKIIKRFQCSFGLFLVFCLLVQCKHIVVNWKGGVIDKYGEYRMASNKIVIFVSADSNLLQYVVKNDKGDTIIRTHENSSIFQSWMLFWDSKENLWVCSSDIGNWVWQKNSQGGYTKVYVL